MRPKSPKKTYTLAPSVTGDGDAGPLVGSKDSSRSRGASRRHSTLPLARSRQIVSNVLPSNAVTKIWPVVKTGEECPGGRAVLQTIFFCRPKCSGRPLEGETPEPFGPRNCVQSAAPSAI